MAKKATKQKSAARQPAEKPDGYQGLGRPSSYRPEFATQAVKLCKLGATDADLADFFEVDITTVWAWKSRHPIFLSSLKLGKDESDQRVERSLYSKANGYTHPAVKIFLTKDGDVVKVPYLEHIPPSDVACIFWLKNRRPDLWRDRQEQGLDKETRDTLIKVVGGLPQ